MRLNNTKVTLVNAEKQEFICGYVRLLDVTPSDVTVTCNTRIRVRSEQVIVSKSLTVESLNSEFVIYPYEVSTFWFY